MAAFLIVNEKLECRVYNAVRVAKKSIVVIDEAGKELKFPKEQCYYFDDTLEESYEQLQIYANRVIGARNRFTLFLKENFNQMTGKSTQF